jgi:hypothetical protein
MAKKIIYEPYFFSACILMRPGASIRSYLLVVQKMTFLRNNHIESIPVLETIEKTHIGDTVEFPGHANLP